MKVLVTGGAGFIGSHTTDALLKAGHDVRIVDNLAKPVHLKGPPAYLQPEAEFIRGDVCDREVMAKALQGVDVVYHLAAYQDYLTDFSKFFLVNAVGTALLYELIVEGDLPIRKVIVASSQAVAGEGLYEDAEGNQFVPDMRPRSQLERGDWEISGPGGRAARFLETPERVANPQNQYALSKHSQERIAIHLGRRYEIPTVAMRYSIVQGPRQSFYNPYSGACRIFSLYLYFDKVPVIYEDGQQVRDFVNIHDVVSANLLVLEDSRANYRVFNVGGGQRCTVAELAEICRDAFGKQTQITLPGLYRFGDIRHHVSDISALRELGWEPLRTVRDSVRECVAYLREQTDVEEVLTYAETRLRDLNVVRSLS